MYPWPLRLLYLSTTTPRRRLTPFLTELPPDFDDYYMILRNLASVKRGVDTPSPFVSLSRFSIDYHTARLSSGTKVPPSTTRQAMQTIPSAGM